MVNHDRIDISGMFMMKEETPILHFKSCVQKVARSLCKYSLMYVISIRIIDYLEILVKATSG